MSRVWLAALRDGVRCIGMRKIPCMNERYDDLLTVYDDYRNIVAIVIISAFGKSLC